jgi:hypothetical protein
MSDNLTHTGNLKTHYQPNEEQCTSVRELSSQTTSDPSYPSSPNDGIVAPPNTRSTSEPLPSTKGSPYTPSNPQVLGQLISSNLSDESPNSEEEVRPRKIHKRSSQSDFSVSTLHAEDPVSCPPKPPVEVSKTPISNPYFQPPRKGFSATFQRPKPRYISTLRYLDMPNDEKDAYLRTSGLLRRM